MTVAMTAPDRIEALLERFIEASIADRRQQ